MKKPCSYHSYESNELITIGTKLEILESLINSRDNLNINTFEILDTDEEFQDKMNKISEDYKTKQTDIINNKIEIVKEEILKQIKELK